MMTTAEIMATTVDCARLGVVHVLMAGDTSDYSEATLDRAVEVVQHYAGPAYDRPQLDHDLIQLADLDRVAQIAPAPALLTEEGRIQMLRAILFVATADGAIAPAPYGAAAEFGLGLELAPNHVRSIIQRFLDDHLPAVDLR